MESSYSPGPWYTSKDAVPNGIVQVSVCAEGTGERVATVFQTEANAHLIASSPELLDALYRAEEQLECSCGPIEQSSVCDCAVAYARAAIDKATGQDS